jgi:hypothetical protein
VQLKRRFVLFELRNTVIFVASSGYSSELILLKVGFILNFLTNGDQSNMIDAVREIYVFYRVSVSSSLD